MKLTKYKSYIKEQFKIIAESNNLKWLNSESEYLLKLESDNVAIEFFSEKWDEETLGIIIIDLKNNKHYTISDLIDLKVGNNSYLDEEDRGLCKNLNDKIKVIIYVSALVLKKYCQEILLGDFSKIN